MSSLDKTTKINIRETVRLKPSISVNVKKNIVHEYSNVSKSCGIKSDDSWTPDFKAKERKRSGRTASEDVEKDEVRRKRFHQSTLAALGMESGAADFDIMAATKTLPVVPDLKTSKTSIVDENMFKPRKDRQRVFAGRRKHIFVENILPLTTLCQNVLSAHLDYIDNVGPCPYFLLKPALENCSPKQLNRIVELNPDLAEESNELFLKFLRMEWPKYRDAKYDRRSVNWRDLYNKKILKRDTEEKEKLERLKGRISINTRKNDTARRTQVIDQATAPRDIRRKQMKNGTGGSVLSTVTALDLSKARKEVGKGNTSKLASMPSSLVGRSSQLGAHKKSQPPKCAPLMLKSLKMLKNQRK